MVQVRQGETATSIVQTEGVQETLQEKQLPKNPIFSLPLIPGPFSRTVKSRSFPKVVSGLGTTPEHGAAKGDIQKSQGY